MQETKCVSCGTGNMEMPEAETCPECGEAALKPEGGCTVCQNCFWSPCK